MAAERIAFDVSIGGSKGEPGTPPGVQILSFSCSFQQKICKIIALSTVGAPPQENPGFATGFRIKKATEG